MALRNIWNTTQKQFQMSSLDVDNFEIDNIPINGITGATGSNGSVGSLSQVLGVSNNANNLNITNVNQMQCNNGVVFGTTGTLGNLQFNYNNSTGSNFSISSGSSTSGDVEFAYWNNSGKQSQPMTINTDGTLYLGDNTVSNPMVYIVNSAGVRSRIYDQTFNPPPMSGITGATG